MVYLQMAVKNRRTCPNCQKNNIKKTPLSNPNIYPKTV